MACEKLQHESWRTGWREKVAVLLEGFSDGLQGIRTWSDLLVLLAQTAVHWMMVVVTYFWVFHALRGELLGAELFGGDAGAGIYAGRLGGAAPWSGRWSAGGKFSGADADFWN